MTKKGRLRDNQRSKVYKAEKIIWYFGENFETIEKVNAYISHICKSKYWQKLGGAPFIIVKDGRGRRNACAHNHNTISLPKWARREEVILHELAHTIANYKKVRVESHGKEFAKVYLLLVRHFMGKMHHDNLRNAFKLFRVHYFAKIKMVTLTDL